PPLPGIAYSTIERRRDGDEPGPAARAMAAHLAALAASI
ncbi:LysR family transcriptional regulator, partial [Burkholderia sp. Ac-20379]|nr:LysR family transcriptional regulator [Burkholderia sp. Ac-20379]